MQQNTSCFFISKMHTVHWNQQADALKHTCKFSAGLWRAAESAVPLRTGSCKVSGDSCAVGAVHQVLRAALEHCQSSQCCPC